MKITGKNESSEYATAKNASKGVKYIPPPKENDEETVQCDFCKRRVPMKNATQLVGKTICDDCRKRASRKGKDIPASASKGAMPPPKKT